MNHSAELNLFTRADLARAVHRHTGIFVSDETPEERLARIVQEKGIGQLAAGNHDGRKVTVAAGFELVFGRRLTLAR